MADGGVPLAARRLYRAALSADPQSSVAAASWAKIMADNGDMDGADELYQRAVQGFPRNPEVQFEYGCFLEGRMRDRGLAEVMYHKVLEANPKHVGCLNNLGNFAILRNDTHAAEDLYRRAMEVSLPPPGPPRRASLPFLPLEVDKATPCLDVWRVPFFGG